MMASLSVIEYHLAPRPINYVAPSRWDSSLSNYLFLGSENTRAVSQPWMLHVKKIIVRVDGCVWHAEGFALTYFRETRSHRIPAPRNPIIRTHLKQLFVLTIRASSSRAVTANSDGWSAFRLTRSHHLHTRNNKVVRIFRWTSPPNGIEQND